jgi:CBS domain-containing protein
MIIINNNNDDNKNRKKKILVVDDEPVHSALMLMGEGGISRVVVVVNEEDDNYNKPVGVITGRDVLSVAALYDNNNKDYYVEDITRKSKTKSDKKRYFPFIPSGIKSVLLVSDVMTANPITTTGDSDLADAAYLMLRNRISGLPVVNDDNKHQVLQGIVTKTDVVKALASHG